jgi:hypothetical protein
MSLPPTGSFRRGGRTCGASPFFSDLGISHRRLNWAPSSPEVRFFDGFLLEIRYWLRKHRIDIPMDSQGWFAYFGFVIGLENP